MKNGVDFVTLEWNRELNSYVIKKKISKIFRKLLGKIKTEIFKKRKKSRKLPKVNSEKTLEEFLKEFLKESGGITENNGVVSGRILAYFVEENCKNPEEIIEQTPQEFPGEILGDLFRKRKNNGRTRTGSLG